MQSRTLGPCLAAINRTITETNRIRFVLFGMQNRTLGPCLAATNRTLISVASPFSARTAALQPEKSRGHAPASVRQRPRRACARLTVYLSASPLPTARTSAGAVGCEVLTSAVQLRSSDASSGGSPGSVGSAAAAAVYTCRGARRPDGQTPQAPRLRGLPGRSRPPEDGKTHFEPDSPVQRPGALS
jgi:hypothetical protein